jgi:O-succinylbenzoic acid--CoA ligase
MHEAPTILPNWLAQRAASAPERLALQCEGQEWSFRALDAWATATAQQLAAAGAQPGERMALLLNNRPEYVALIHAAPRLGISFVPLNTRLAAPELAWQLHDSGSKLLIYDETTAALATVTLAAMAEAPRALMLGDLAAQPRNATKLQDTINLDDIFTIIYTSGTTGRPKGAMLTYGNYWWSAVGSALNLGTHTTDRWLAVLPLFHVGGLSIAIRAAIYGIPMLLHRAFDAAAVNRAIDTDGVTIVSVVSTMVQRMLTTRGPHPYPPTLRCLLLGGGPAPRPLLEACAQLGMPVAQTYGMTETASQVATLAPADALRKLGSAGMPLLPTTLRIEQDGAEVGPGEIGEIVVRGPTVMCGYINRPDATTQALRDGWLHTGDLGYRDAEGFLFVVSRRTDLIISGGENIYPAEIEAVLLAHPAVAEAAALGIADAQWGQVPAAAVVLHAGATATSAELVSYCRTQLASYKAPRHIRLLSELPRNAAGKVVRAELQALFVA